MASTMKLDHASQTNPSQSINQAQRSKDKPILIVLVILGLASAASLGVGMACLGATQGWWAAGALSHVSQINAIVIISAGAGGAFISFVVGCVCLSRKEEMPPTEVSKDKQRFTTTQSVSAPKVANQSAPPTQSAPPIQSAPPTQSAPRTPSPPVMPSVPTIQPPSAALSPLKGMVVLDKVNQIWDQSPERLGSEAWKVFGDVGIVPPLPQDINSAFDPATHYLILIPATLDGKPVTIKMLCEKFGITLSENLQACGDRPVNKSYWVILNRIQLPETYGKSASEQQEILPDCHFKGYSNYYHLPTCIEAMILDAFAQKYNFWRLLTRCEEQVTIGTKSYHLAVGPSPSFFFTSVPTQFYTKSLGDPSIGAIGAHRYNL
jgi:hypothetical protein